MQPSGGPVSPAGPEFPPAGVEWRRIFSLSYRSGPRGPPLVPLPWKPALNGPPGNLSSPHLNLLFGETLTAPLMLPLPSSCGDTYKSLLPLSGSCPGAPHGPPTCVSAVTQHSTLLARVSTWSQLAALQAKRIPLFPFYDLLKYQKLHSLGSFQESGRPTAPGRSRRRTLRVKGTILVPSPAGYTCVSRDLLLPFPNGACGGKGWLRSLTQP